MYFVCFVFNASCTFYAERLLILLYVSHLPTTRSGRPSELIPPLPSQQVMHMTVDMDTAADAETDFQEVREVCLRKWLVSVFARQSCETDEYRAELRKFLTCSSK
jgi:hypothetical protein